MCLQFSQSAAFLTTPSSLQPYAKVSARRHGGSFAVNMLRPQAATKFQSNFGTVTKLAQNELAPIFGHCHDQASHRMAFHSSPCASDMAAPTTRCRMTRTQASGWEDLAASEDDDDELNVPPRYEGTIYAQSTAVGMGGIAVVRVSGVDALSSLARLSKPGAKPPTPRYATLRTLMDPKSGALIDKGLVLFFPGPNSFTGEDIVEYHVHGGVAIVNSLLSALANIPGLRMATRGEFTKRAYLNGRMDLLEAEALNDLIHAETSGQQKQAMMQMGGAHRKLYQGWRTAILQCLAHVNAFIDYGDSEGLEEEATLAPVRQDAEVGVHVACVCVRVCMYEYVCDYVCVCVHAHVYVCVCI